MQGEVTILLPRMFWNSCYESTTTQRRRL